MWDIIKNALSKFSSSNDQPKSKGTSIKLTPLNLKQYAKQEDQKLTAKQDATAFRSPTKPVSNSSAGVAKALMAQRANTKAQEKEAYYNPELKDIKVNNPILNTLYHNQWLMDVPVLGSVIKRGAKEVAERSFGGGYVGEMKELLEQPNEQGVLMGKDNKYSGLTNFQGNQRVMPKLVDQYFSDKPLFQNSKYKPTSDYLTFLPSYSLKGDYDKKLVTDSKLNEKFKTTIDEVLGVENRGKDTERRNAAIAPKVYNEFLKNKKTIYMPYSELGPMARFIGADLGAHKVGLAWDKEKNLPYISVSDAWDFEPKAWVKKRIEGGDLNDEEGKKLADQMYAQASLMHKAGKPFKIYDRFYFDPKTKKYISDAEVARIRPSKINTDKTIPVDREAIARRLGLKEKNNK
jgi:hypothetical protein